MAIALALPGAASAKVFVSHFTDPSGDAPRSSLDIVSGRVAYDRRTGAVSASLTVAGQIDTSSSDLFAVGLSNLVNGKCTKEIMAVGGEFDQPTLGIGELMGSQGVLGPTHVGTGSVDGNTVSVRVKNKALSGKTVGCVLALTESKPAAAGDAPTIYDHTSIDNGFNG